jgi:hypothetical protein
MMSDWNNDADVRMCQIWKRGITASWSDLEWAVNLLRTSVRFGKKNETPNHRKIWGLLKTSPIDENAIGALIEDEWYVVVEDINALGYCSEARKRIQIRSDLVGFSRDTTLFHELAHAFYNDEIDHYKHGYVSENLIIIEWLSRKLRSDADLLRHTINAFDLEQYIYDKVSYEAFTDHIADLSRQKEFPFAKEHYDRLRLAQMDYA